MRVFNLGSSHGGVAVSNAGGRGFDTFRACGLARRASSPGHLHLDNCTDIVIGVAAGGSMAGASRLTGGAPGSYPGTDWVRDPGRALHARFVAGALPL